jgi:hypothetical protein
VEDHTLARGNKINKMFTVYSEYYGTGEGVTRMILFTRARPCEDDYEVQPSFDAGVYKEGILKNEPKVLALKHFTRIFGSFFALGAVVNEGLDFDNNVAQLLISPELQKNLEKWSKNAFGFEYHTKLHLNFS